MTKFGQKISILRKAKKVFKNWSIYPIAYLNLVQNKEIIFYTKTNKNIKIRRDSTDLMALTHVWLIEEYKYPGFEIKENDIIIDVGAHIGLFTLYASQFCNSGKIFSYEPMKENYKLLVDNVNGNNLDNIRTFNFAVSNSETIKLYINDDESGHSMFSKSSDFTTVDSISLKKIFDENRIEYCDFLKLDCEGAEYEIIESLPTEYFKKIKKIIIEYHMADSHPELLLKLKKTLESKNYKIEIKELFSDIGFLYAKQN